MSKSKYDESRVIRSLSTNYGAAVGYEFGFKRLEIPIAYKGEIGIHSLGMIDYLVNYCEYRPPVYVDRKSGGKRPKKTDDIDSQDKKEKRKPAKMKKDGRVQV